MNWQDLGKKLIAVGLPAIGAQLAGPAGPAGAAVGREIARRIGVADATPEVLAHAVDAGDQSVMLALARIEADAEAAARADSLRAQELADTDRQRAREAHKGSRMPAILTVLVFVMFSGAFAALFFVEIPSSNRDIAYLAFGTQLSAFTAVVGYWIGSSRGSADKAQTLDTMLRK